MRLFYTDHFDLPLPDSHRFPMRKYRDLRRRVAEYDLHLGDALLVPPAATDAQLMLAHCAQYIDRVATGRLSEPEIRRIGFPWSLKMAERSRRSTGATIAASRAALTEGFAANLAGGTHHAFADCGEGYCVFNDSAVAMRVLLEEGSIRRGIIIDCDVHQGNGTAAILADDTRVFTFSIHGAKNFPSRKHPSDLDVPLPDGVDDAFYLDALQRGLDQALSHGPFDIAIYLAGADPFEGDRLGRLKVTKQGLARRDLMVLDSCQQANIPVAVAMAGGYAPRIEDIVDIHAQTLAAFSIRANEYERRGTM
jgi:acetoin utilization deacetylase AcuC-like enzyme